MQAAWEKWMTDSEHTFTKTARQRWASYATICQRIVDAWAKISVSSIIQSFRKAEIISEQHSENDDIDLDCDEMDPSMLYGKIAQLFDSETEDENFNGFFDKE